MLSTLKGNYQIEHNKNDEQTQYTAFTCIIFVNRVRFKRASFF